MKARFITGTMHDGFVSFGMDINKITFWKLWYADGLHRLFVSFGSVAEAHEIASGEDAIRIAEYLETFFMHVVIADPLPPPS